MKTRIYKVTNGENVYLVRAPSQAQAVKYVTSRQFQVIVATQDDLEAYLPKTTVETWKSN